MLCHGAFLVQLHPQTESVAGEDSVQSKTFRWQFVTFFRILFAGHLLYSGGAYIFFGWVPSAFPDPAQRLRRPAVGDRA